VLEVSPGLHVPECMADRMRAASSAKRQRNA
jgi:hypothetical protein